VSNGQAICNQPGRSDASRTARKSRCPCLDISGCAPWRKLPVLPIRTSNSKSIPQRAIGREGVATNVPSLIRWKPDGRQPLARLLAAVPAALRAAQTDSSGRIGQMDYITGPEFPHPDGAVWVFQAVEAWGR
jgi:hypothetical protein